MCVTFLIVCDRGHRSEVRGGGFYLGKEDNEECRLEQKEGERGASEDPCPRTRKKGNQRKKIRM